MRVWRGFEGLEGLLCGFEEFFCGVFVANSNIFGGLLKVWREFGGSLGGV